MLFVLALIDITGLKYSHAYSSICYNLHSICYNLLSHPFLNLGLFVTKVGIPSIAFESVDVECDDDDNSEHNLPEVIEDTLIVIDKKNPKRDDTHRPDDRTDHIVHPEFVFSHPTRSRDKGDKGTGKIVKFPEDDIPESIFLYLLVEDLIFCFSESDPVAIFFDNLLPIPFPDPVSEVVPEHRSDDSTEYGPHDMGFPPESTDEDHHVHPWDRRPDDRKWFHTGGKKGNEIVPVPDVSDELSDPLNPDLDPLRSDEGNKNERERKQRKKYSNSFRKVGEGSSDHRKIDISTSRVWKKMAFAKGKKGFIEIKNWHSIKYVYIHIMSKKYFNYLDFAEDHPEEAWKQEREWRENAGRLVLIIWSGILAISITSLVASETVRNFVSEILLNPISLKK